MRDLLLADFPFLASLASSERPNDRRIWLRVAIDHFITAEPSDSGMIAEFIEAMTAQLAAAELGHSAGNRPQTCALRSCSRPSVVCAQLH